VFVTQVMARNQSQKPPLSSKKMARQGKKRPPKKAPVVSSSSSESDAEFEQPPLGSAAGAPDEYQSDGSLLGDQPPSQASDGDRSPELAAASVSFKSGVYDEKQAVNRLIICIVFVVSMSQKQLIETTSPTIDLHDLFPK
jgi:hypothetical protein